MEEGNGAEENTGVQCHQYSYSPSPLHVHFIPFSKPVSGRNSSSSSDGSPPDRYSIWFKISGAEKPCSAFENPKLVASILAMQYLVSLNVDTHHWCHVKGKEGNQVIAKILCSSMIIQCYELKEDKQMIKNEYENS